MTGSDRAGDGSRVVKAGCTQHTRHANAGRLAVSSETFRVWMRVDACGLKDVNSEGPCQHVYKETVCQTMVFVSPTPSNPGSK